VFDARIGDISGRGKLAGDMREIWLMQPRFDRRTASSAAGLASQVRFRAGYDFLRLRADTGEVPIELADWWEDFHLGTDEEREALLADLRSTSQPKLRRVPGPAPNRAPDAAAGPSEGLAAPPVDTPVDGAPASDDAAPVRKRRRRRRRPGTAEAANGASDDLPGRDDDLPPPRVD